MLQRWSSEIYEESLKCTVGKNSRWGLKRRWTRCSHSKQTLNSPKKQTIDVKVERQSRQQWRAWGGFIFMSFSGWIRDEKSGLPDLKQPTTVFCQRTRNGRSSGNKWIMSAGVYLSVLLVISCHQQQQQVTAGSHVGSDGWASNTTRAGMFKNTNNEVGVIRCVWLCVCLFNMLVVSRFFQLSHDKERKPQAWIKWAVRACPHPDGPTLKMS